MTPCIIRDESQLNVSGSQSASLVESKRLRIGRQCFYPHTLVCRQLLLTCLRDEGVECLLGYVELRVLVDDNILYVELIVRPLCTVH